MNPLALPLSSRRICLIPMLVQQSLTDGRDGYDRECPPIMEGRHQSQSPFPRLEAKHVASISPLLFRSEQSNFHFVMVTEAILSHQPTAESIPPQETSEPEYLSCCIPAMVATYRMPPLNFHRRGEKFDHIT